MSNYALARQPSSFQFNLHPNLMLFYGKVVEGCQAQGQASYGRPKIRA